MEPGPPLGEFTVEFSGLGEDVQDAVDSLAQVIRFKERQRAGLQQYAAIVGSWRAPLLLEEAFHPVHQPLQHVPAEVAALSVLQDELLVKPCGKLQTVLVHRLPLPGWCGYSTTGHRRAGPPVLQRLDQGVLLPALPVLEVALHRGAVLRV
ncbi:hypothetical protein [Streptomyces malaysiensis]|uniref:hypothetical protein n=1 Tax=Streptomyces malaysiensis TaxID=92644 RepID=UPI003D7C1C35